MIELINWLKWKKAFFDQVQLISILIRIPQCPVANNFFFRTKLKTTLNINLNRNCISSGAL